MTGATRPAMLYDPDCGLCTRCADLVRRMGSRVDVVAGTPANLAACAVDPVRFAGEMALVHPDGTIAWGHHAWAGVLRQTRGLAWAGRVLDSGVAERPGAAAYRFVAANRWRLPGSSCAMPTDRDAAGR